MSSEWFDEAWEGAARDGSPSFYLYDNTSRRMNMSRLKRPAAIFTLSSATPLVAFIDDTVDAPQRYEIRCDIYSWVGMDEVRQIYERLIRILGPAYQPTADGLVTDLDVEPEEINIFGGVCYFTT